MNMKWQAAIASHWLPEAWARAVEEVLRSFDVSGSAPPMQASADTPDRDAWADWTEARWFSQECDAAAKANLQVGAPRETLLAVWQVVSGEEPELGADLTTALETYRELLNQAASTVADELGAKLGRTIRIAPAVEAETMSAATPAVEIRLEAPGGASLVFALGLSAELAALLFDPETPSQQPPSEPPPEPEDSSQAVVRQGSTEESLRLLKKVELDLAVSFGQTSMTLEQAMKLASGSIVELNRSVSEPVELLVNESVIARGEVVVVDGNYGVRITEIARPDELVQDFL